MKQIVKALVFVITLLVMFIPANASADGPDFGIKPFQPGIGYYRFTIEPGDSVDDMLLATNVGNESVFVKVMPVGAISAIGGGLSYDFANKSDVVNWISMPDAGILKIKSGSFYKMPFKITVPEGTKPGEYVAGFLAGLDESHELQSTLAPNSFNIKVVSQIAVAVVITVPGESECKAEAKRIEDFPSNTGWHFEIYLDNLGNVPFSGKGLLEVETDGTVTQSKQFNLGYTVAGLPFRISADLEPPKAGNQKITLSIIDKNFSECAIKYEFQKKISNKEATVIKKAISTPISKMINSTPTAISTLQLANDNSLSATKPDNTILIFSIIILLLALILFAVSYFMLKRRK